MTFAQNNSLPKESFTDTVRRLAGAQKPPAKGSPAYSRFVNRKIGRVIAAAAYQLGLTPNQVTFISAAFSAVSIAAIALAQPNWWIGVLIAVGLLIGYAFDSADGQLARLRGGGTPAGEWLDHVVDSIKTTALHLAVLIGWYRHYDVTDIELLLIPIGFTLVASVFFFVQILTDQLRRAHPERAPAPADSSASATLRSILVIPTDYGVLCGIFVLFGWQAGFVVAYALLLAGTSLFLCAALPKWYREIRNF
ncbi:CDP-alcohol phosphatidyltransferase family protein [Rhodococcus sp. ARC_M6]|uniref:CDP-alcohol phosphatidyltransferase family protein n=1 Tax=Rhodococcus sp. ARC_M6 TaxID=2928852 RepID=UPI001FB4EA5B|nr:CDP-alcohol phosphatidyltransferase family protein [Rhodococcus sp. ARC_M6]MCJ0904448.1 CDP-alcohol phosphatidyltransferase family protein [Rhodococcus sp. ARC_M6]